MCPISAEKVSNLFIKSDLVLNRCATADYKRVNDNLLIENIVFVYDGKGKFVKNGETAYISRGDVVYFESGCDRSLETDKDDCLKMYSINFVYVEPVYRNRTWVLEKPPLGFDFVKKITNEHTFNKLVELFERLISLCLLPYDGTDPGKRDIIISILKLICGLYAENSFNYATRKTVESVIKYMQDNIKEKITLNSLAKFTGTSPSHLGRIFRGVTGMSPIDFLIKTRINNAKAMLKDGVSVSKTAEECGFCDVYYFSSMFKKIEKIPPYKYAKIAKQDLINSRYHVF